MIKETTLERVNVEIDDGQEIRQSKGSLMNLVSKHKRNDTIEEHSLEGSPDSKSKITINSEDQDESG